MQIGTARCIMGFAGHMIDHPDRETARFPGHAEGAVQSAIRAALLRYEPQIAISSAACGGDIIFAEQALFLNIPLYIILPFEDREEFIEKSVAYAGDVWINRFHAVCARANAVLYVNPGGFRDTTDFEKNQHAIVFFALGYSKAADIQMVNLALYDSTLRPDGQGGTESFMELSKGLKLPYDVINLADIRSQLKKE